jgi:hypothetical protein
LGQTPKRKTPRAAAPEFRQADFDGVFFKDVGKQLVGPRPSPASTKAAIANDSRDTKIADPADPESNATPSQGKSWSARIQPASLEDLIKAAKRRLDGIVTTPAKFAGGGFKDARREFTLVTLLLGVIEQHDGQVRWKQSAKVGRARFARAAAGAKVGSSQAYSEAKLRLQDLSDLLNGTPWNASSGTDPLEWSDALDHGPLMQLLEFALRENLTRATSTSQNLSESAEEAIQYAELIAAIGYVLGEPQMPNADDAEYTKWSRQMMEQAMAAAKAIRNQQPDEAKKQTGLIDQSCNQCHNAFR